MARVMDADKGLVSRVSSLIDQLSAQTTEYGELMVPYEPPPPSKGRPNGYGYMSAEWYGDDSIPSSPSDDEVSAARGYLE